MNNKDKQNGRYVWVPITAWYGDGQGNIHGIDIDDTDVVAMHELISKKRDASYWQAVLYKAQNVETDNELIEKLSLDVHDGWWDDVRKVLLSLSKYLGDVGHEQP